MGNAVLACVVCTMQIDFGRKAGKRGEKNALTAVVLLAVTDSDNPFLIKMKNAQWRMIKNQTISFFTCRRVFIFICLVTVHNSRGLIGFPHCNGENNSYIAV